MAHVVLVASLPKYVSLTAIQPLQASKEVALREANLLPKVEDCCGEPNAGGLLAEAETKEHPTPHWNMGFLKERGGVPILGI